MELSGFDAGVSGSLNLWRADNSDTAYTDGVEVVGAAIPFNGATSSYTMDIYENNIYSNRKSTNLNGNAFQLLVKQVPLEFGRIKEFSDSFGL